MNDLPTAEKDATIKALVRALEKHYGKGKKWPLPSIPIGTRVRVHDSGAAGVGTVVGRDGYGFDGVIVIFDEPAPRGFEDGCCAGVEQCEILNDTRPIPPASTCCADHDDCHLSGELICCDRCPDIERCACGHGWHQHDPEAVPPICMACGDAERCVTQPAPCPTCEHPEGYDRLSGPCPTCQGTGVMPPEGGKP